jgi:hypothetical protein
VNPLNFEKIMKRILLILMLYLAGFNLAIGQVEKYNLEKYWRYKDRFLKEFIVLPTGQTTSAGFSIPAENVNVNDAGDKILINFTDGNANLSHYLGVLSTEYKLLKNNGDNYDQTLKELYYVFLAIDRLDQTSESFFRSDGLVQAADKNGWMIRDDVTPQFFGNNFAKFGFETGDPSQLVSGYHATGMYEKESFSQDNVYHLLEGLALVNKLVSTEYVDVAGKSVDFAAWSKDITTRVIRMMQHSTNIYLLNKTDKPFECLFSPPSNWQWILDPGWAVLKQTTYEACCNGFKTGWYVQNPVTGQLAQEGSGVDFDTWGFFSYGLVRAGNKITNVDYNFDQSSGNLQKQLFTSWFNGETTGSLDAVATAISAPVFDFITTSLIGLPAPLPSGVKLDIVKALGAPIVGKDPYKIKTLATIGNVFDGETFWKLRTSERNRYGHFMLMSALLHGTPSAYTSTSSEFLEDKNYFSDLLFKAPCTGPRNFRTASDDDYNIEWSAQSRLVWPERNGFVYNNEKQTYNGLDYMFLHNLYCLVYQSGFQKLTARIKDDVVSRTKSDKAVNIIASNKISGSSVVTYSASKIVKLITGFSVSPGATFKAKNLAPSAYDNFNQNNSCIPHVSSGREASINEDEDVEAAEISPVYLSVVPNPNQGAFDVILNASVAESSIKQITIFDVTGQRVFNDQFTGRSLNINLSHVKSRGIFIVSVVSGNKIYQKKLIIE